MSRIARFAGLLACVVGLLVAAPLDARAQAQAQSRHGALFRPEDLGQLESADRDTWQKPDQIMDALGVADGSRVADVGAGGGWFTVRLARRVGPQGIVVAEDVQPQMVEATRRRVEKESLHNVHCIKGTTMDPMLAGTPYAPLDAALLVEAYQEIQNGNPQKFLENVRAALRPGGRVGIVDYKKEGGGPGPDGARPNPETIEQVAARAGLRLVKRETFLPFQFLLVFVK